MNFLFQWQCMLGEDTMQKKSIDRFYLLIQVEMKEGFSAIAWDLPLIPDFIKL